MAAALMAIRFYSKSDTHREFSNCRAVRRKFELHPELKAMLLATGEEELIESVPTDTYWGVGRDGTGLNLLGKIIARIRVELRVGG